MKKIYYIPVWVLILATTYGCSYFYVHKEKEKTPYNILFIMDDQHRGDYIGALGNDWLHTPNLDRLAWEGVLFDKGYTSMPSCLPARAALLTGKSPWAHGMLMYTDIPESYRDEKPKMLGDKGYYTISIGKNHFINAPLKIPKTITHDYNEQHLEEGWRSIYPGVDERNCDYANWFYSQAPERDLNATNLSYTDHRGGRYFLHDEKLHPTNWTASKAIEFLQTYKEEKPWFMKVSFQRPHAPFDPPKRWVDFYKKRNIPEANVGSWAEERYKGLEPDSLENNPNRRYGKYSHDEIYEARKAYCAAISHVDEQLGRVLDALKERGELENTFIIFTSDHGDMMGDQHMWAKCRPYEPSVKVPYIIRWPEKMKLKTPRGQIRHELVELRDVLPTFLEVAEITQPADMDGSSIINLLKNEGEWRKTLDFEHGQIYEDDNAWVALTDGKYKYIYFTLTGKQQLFDLENDPNEMIDISKNPVYKERLKFWREQMIAHLTVRGEPWVKNGDLNIQKKSITWRKGYPEALQ